MNQRDHQRPSVRRLPSNSRTPISLSPERLVKAGYLKPDEPFPLVVEPMVEGLNLAEWARNNLPFIEGELLKHGAILFRNFNTDSVNSFQQFVSVISPDLLDYYERTVQRSVIEGRIYTASEYPAAHAIPLHNEYSFSHAWPLKLWFFCVQPADKGGETLIADGRKVFSLIPEKIKARFIEKGVMYVRNYGEGLDLSWEEVFQITDRAEVEQYFRHARIQFEWKEANRLRTRQVRQAVARHAGTGEDVWFNQAHLFHVSSLAQAAHDSLLASFSEDDLPRHAFYGDGSRLEYSDLDEIRQAYRQATVALSWKQGDVVMLDNMLVAHGRAPFQGPRKILVAMADLVHNKTA